MKKSQLDKRICDCEKGATNTQTYREFIETGYKELGCPLCSLNNLKLDSKSELELNEMIEELDWLLDK